VSVADPVWARFDARYPWLPWMRRWGVSLCSLVLGFATLFVFRRGLPHVRWIVGYLLLLWFLFVILAEAQAALERRGRRFIIDAGEYAMLTLCHGLLLFVLPAYYASATLTSTNVVVLILIGVAALVTAIDPAYQRFVHPWAWRRHLLVAFSVFVALNVALPLVGVQPILALEGSAAVAVLALTPAFRRGGAVGWGGAIVAATLLAGLAVVTVWYGRGLVPPAPLFLTERVAARAVTDLSPVDVIDRSIPAATVEAWGGLAAYTAVHAPGGLRQPILHVWSRNGVTFARIPLSPVRGGRTEGFRTYSVTRHLLPPLHGRYTVDVMTASGQLIGRLRFKVSP